MDDYPKQTFHTVSLLFQMAMFFLTCLLIMPEPVCWVFDLGNSPAEGRVLVLVAMAMVTAFWLSEKSRYNKDRLLSIRAGVSTAVPALVVYEGVASLVWWRNIILSDSKHVDYISIHDLDPSVVDRYKTIVVDVHSETSLELISLSGIVRHHSVFFV